MESRKSEVLAGCEAVVLIDSEITQLFIIIIIVIYGVISWVFRKSINLRSRAQFPLLSQFYFSPKKDLQSLAW